MATNEKTASQAASRKALGRGLDALLSNRPGTAAAVAPAPAPEPGEQVRMISLDAIDANPDQPRTVFEGSAIEDYDRPSQIIIGELDPRSGDAVGKMYGEIEATVVRTTIRTAEMVKYVSNAFHALKVVFANEIGNLSKAHGIDGQQVMQLFCHDQRLNISAKYLRPGFAFGGSCLPKDVRALVYRAKEKDLECPVLGALLESNQKQVQRGINMVEAALTSGVTEKRNIE